MWQVLCSDWQQWLVLAERHIRQEAWHILWAVTQQLVLKLCLCCNRCVPRQQEGRLLSEGMALLLPSGH